MRRIFKVPLEAFRKELTLNPNWTPNVLEMAEYGKFLTGIAKFRGGMHSKLLDQTAQSFVIRGVIFPRCLSLLSCP